MRSSARFFNTHAIPGLRFVKNFFSENERTKLVFLLHDLRKILISRSNDKPFTVSKKHNLSSEEKYKSVNLDNERRGQFFPSYGEAGHELTYFIGNKNIPEF